jgi:hypothetical protein
VLLRRCLVVRKPPSTDPTPLAHPMSVPLRMRLGASRARDTGHATRHGRQAAKASAGPTWLPWLLPHKRFLGHHAEIRVYAWRCGDECREAITMLALGMTSGADE